MRSIKKITAALATSVLLLPIVVLAVSPPPTIPLLVYGDVSLYGVTVPVGTIIAVSDGSTTIATTTVNSAGKYYFQIPASYAGSLLTYKIGSLVAAEKVCANPMITGSDRIDLIIEAAPAPAPSGGGGGGGGSYAPLSTPTPLSSEAKKADTNNDNKIDVMDFNSLMVNWGNTGTSVADFNGDGHVDIFDFNYLMIYWVG